MKGAVFVLCAVIFAAAAAEARGGSRGFTGGRGVSGAARGYSGGRGGFSRAASRPTFIRTPSARPASRSGFASSSGSRGGFSRGFGGFSRALSRPTFGRAAFHAAASKTAARRVAGSDSGGTPAWATPGAKIVSAGQPPVYSDPGNGGTHSVEGGGFIAMDQSKAADVGRAPGIAWSAPDKTMSAGASGEGGGTGASSNGPAFNPAF